MKDERKADDVVTPRSGSPGAGTRIPTDAWTSPSGSVTRSPLPELPDDKYLAEPDLELEAKRALPRPGLPRPSLRAVAPAPRAPSRPMARRTRNIGSREK